MKPLFRNWPGLQVAAAVALSALTTHAATQVKTLGGGPNQSGLASAGSFNGDTLLAAKFNNPYGVAVDTNGNLLIADRSNNKIRKISKPGAADSLTSTFSSRLPAPVGVAVDSANNVFVVTYSDGRLRKLSSSASLLRNVSGLVKPTALALDADGNVFVTELGGKIKRIAPNNTITTVATGLNKPQGIAVLANGMLAVSEAGAHAIRTVNPTNGTSVVIAGGNAPGFNDGEGSTARFNQPYGLALAPNGTLVVADRLNHRVRLIEAIGTNHIVSTLYGVDRTEWSSSFSGWVDGPGGLNGTAAAREPAGLTVAKGGTVYIGELYWDLIRQASGTGLGSTNGTGNTTNVVINGTNVVSVVGTNVISFGFESGEASSVFVGAAGQKFYAPVTLAPAPGQKVYTFQLSLSVTGETGVVVDPSESHFVSMMDQQLQVITRDDLFIPPVFTTNTSYVPITNNVFFRNDAINMLGVGWLTRYEKTNMYNTLGQDLITYSIAKDTLLGSSQGKVVVGAYGVRIPNTATTNDSFLIAISNPSGTADGVTRPVPLTIPMNGSMSNGAPNSIKRVTMGSKLYVVGDSTPFNWFNAGDFGDARLANSDVMDVFQAAAYHINQPIEDSDLFNAMDSSNGNSISSPDDLFNGDAFYTAGLINSISTGDAQLNLDDVFVTFRRSLDPTLKWFARYWSNGLLQAVEVTNSLTGGAGSKSIPAVRKTLNGTSISRPALAVAVDDVLAKPNTTLRLPIRVQLGDAFPLRTLLLNLSVEALDGSPAIANNIQLQMAPAFGDPDISDSRGANNLAGAWLDNQVAGLTGNSVLAILTVHIPAAAGSDAAYRVHFDHFSASPNGVALFDSQAASGLVTMSDRSASTWGDGIADAWRLRYFSSIYAPESALGADADGDGVINAIEYQNGTNPTDSSSN